MSLKLHVRGQPIIPHHIVMAPDSRPFPPAAGWCIAFFLASGALELLLPMLDGGAAGRSPWDATGQALLHWLLAAGLWQRFRLCQLLALVYCLAALVTYGVTLGLALAGAPVRAPLSLVVMSLFQVPSCAVLLPWLRSGHARAAFPRRLRG
jgi:hypothetical protein